MLKRTVLSASAFAVLAGCGAGTKFHAAIDAGRWTPDFAGSALTLTPGDTTFDLVGQGGVPEDEALWFFDASFRIQAPRGKQVQPFSMNLGYWQQVYEGTGPGGATFAGSPLPLGADTRTSAEFKLYSIGYEEVRPTQGARGCTSGLFGLQYLDFDITAVDGVGTTGAYADGAPMFVFGWKISYAGGAGAPLVAGMPALGAMPLSGRFVYYFSITGMDTDYFFAIENVEGNILDSSAGIRWFMRGGRFALSIGYRKYEADLRLKSGTVNVNMDGLALSLFLSW